MRTFIWGWEEDEEGPNQQGTLNKLPSELRRRDFVSKHRLSIQVGVEREKTCMQHVYIPTAASILHTTLGGWGGRKKNKGGKFNFQVGNTLKEQQAKVESFGGWVDHPNLIFFSFWFSEPEKSLLTRESHQLREEEEREGRPGEK